MQRCRVLMIIQGEGRGHMTQAVSLSQMFAGSEFELAACIVGMSTQGVLSPIIADQLDCPIIPLASPNLIYCKKTSRVRVRRTILNGVLHFGRYFNGINKIHEIVEKQDIQLIINFYDVLGGVYNLCVNQNKIPFVSIAHQYLLMHPEFPHPKGFLINKILVNLNSWITSAKSSKRLALSFKKEMDDHKRRIITVPPLLRESILQLNPEIEHRGKRVLAYCTQRSMTNRIKEIQLDYPNFEIHLFSNRTQDNPTVLDESGIFFHKIDNQLFIEMMLRCDLLITTAGFESICEAMYLSKPVLMLPLLNHYEQKCNAIDAERAGAGVEIHEQVNLDQLIEGYKPKEVYRSWVENSSDVFLRELSLVIQTKTKRPPLKLTSESLFKYSLIPLRRVLGLLYA